MKLGHPTADPLLRSVIDALALDLDSPNARKAKQFAEQGDWAGVCDLSADPKAFSTAGEYFANVIPTWLKKCHELADPSQEEEREKATGVKWLAAEHQCYRTNLRLKRFKQGQEPLSEQDLAVRRHLVGIRKIIESWIGKRPGRPDLGFSPGSTVTDRGDRSTVAHKLHKSPSTTQHLDEAGFPGFIGTMWHHNMVDAGLEPKGVRGEEYFTVPKKFNIRRAAAMQPTLNASLQVARGRELKKKLKRNTGTSLGKGGILIRRAGWDLRRAQDIHREVAAKASADRSFCTIDLSSASDTLSKVFVELMLPRAWYEALDKLRCHLIEGSPAQGSFSSQAYIELDGELHGPPRPVQPAYLLEKFSAMGNGFTFELETIIFAAMACYVTRHNGFWGELGFDVFVFGDDIIIRDELYSDMKALLEFCGMSVNHEKSFHGQTPFRESCGGDFFNGVDVRGFFTEKAPSGPLELVTLANQIRKCADKAGHLGLNLTRTWFTVLNALPRAVRNSRGPSELGDKVVYDPNPMYWARRRQPDRCRVVNSDFTSAWQAIVVEQQLVIEGASPRTVGWGHFDPATILACAVLGFGDSETGLTLRAKRRNYQDRASQPESYALRWTTVREFSY